MALNTSSDTKLILASASPRRIELLNLIGINFATIPTNIDEAILPNEKATDMVLRLATEKAFKIVSDNLAHLNEKSFIIGADTTVYANIEILGKPVDRNDAYRMLKLLSGNKHQVIGGIALLDHLGEIVEQAVQITEVEFYPLSDQQINSYIDSREPFDKAGAYAIQGIAMQFVKSINGSYSNIVGLDIALVTNWFRKHCII
jgi:septum formation protein